MVPCTCLFGLLNEVVAGTVLYWCHMSTLLQTACTYSFCIRLLPALQLDMRLANADRNGGNILAAKDEATGRWTLTPIDHGYTLPSSLQVSWHNVNE